MYQKKANYASEEPDADEEPLIIIIDK